MIAAAKQKLGDWNVLVVTEDEQVLTGEAKRYQWVMFGIFSTRRLCWNANE